MMMTAFTDIHTQSTEDIRQKKKKHSRRLRIFGIALIMLQDAVNRLPVRPPCVRAAANHLDSRVIMIICILIFIFIAFFSCSYDAIGIITVYTARFWDEHE